MTAPVADAVTATEVAIETPCECSGEIHAPREECPHAATVIVRLHHVHTPDTPTVFALCDDCLRHVTDHVIEVLSSAPWCGTCDVAVRQIADLLTVMPLKGKI